MDEKFNIIQFTFPASPNNVSLTLKLDGDFVWSCGLEPNINRFIVPFPEFDKLGGNPDQTGTLEFFYTQDPSSPGVTADWSIHNVRIVDVSASQVGICATSPSTTGNATFRVVEYVLYLADYRETFVAPRGGRLLDGLMNPGTDDVLYANPLDAATPNQTLATKCLDAMGVSSTDVDDGLNAVNALHNLHWHGAHAPTELAKILEHCNAVFCPQTNGNASVQLTGNGDLPTVPQAQKCYQINLPGIDRRGKSVIFSSAPTAVVDTYSLSGIDKTSGGTNPLLYVLPNPDGSWSAMGTGVAATIQSHGAYSQWAYRCIQINPDMFDQRLRPALARVLDSTEDGASLSAIQVFATIAVQAGDGSWANQGTNLTVTALKQGNVICLAERLGQVTTPTPTPTPTPVSDADASFQEIPGGQGPNVTISMEALAPSPKNNLINVREFFYAGYTMTDGGVVQMTSDQVNTALADPGQDIVIIHRPEFRLVRDQTGASDITQKYSTGETDNSADLYAKCNALAPRYLRGSGQPAQEIVAKGFVPAELSGRLAEMRINQDQVTTTFRVNTWWLPRGQTGKAYKGEGGFGGNTPGRTSGRAASGGGGGGSGAGSGGAAASAGRPGGSPGVPGSGSPSGGSTHSLGGGAFPQAEQTHHEALALGSVQAQQPAVIVQPPPATPARLPPGGTQYMVLQRPSPSDGYKVVWDYLRCH